MSAKHEIKGSIPFQISKERFVVFNNTHDVLFNLKTFPTLDKDFFWNFKNFEYKINKIGAVFSCYDLIFERMTDFMDLETEKCIADLDNK